MSDLKSVLQIILNPKDFEEFEPFLTLILNNSLLSLKHINLSKLTCFYGKYPLQRIRHLLEQLQAYFYIEQLITLSDQIIMVSAKVDEKTNKPLIENKAFQENKPTVCELVNFLKTQNFTDVVFKRRDQISLSLGLIDDLFLIDICDEQDESICEDFLNQYCIDFYAQV